MPGYEPYLLCDFHVHTTWSDGRLTLREVVDLYGQTEKFDVLAITDHILCKKDWLGRIGRMATLGRRRFSITPETFDDYMTDIEKESIRAKHNSHIVALGLKKFISADLNAKEILEQIRNRTRSASRVIHITGRRAGWKSGRATCGITAKSSPTWSMCGRRPIATTCSP